MEYGHTFLGDENISFIHNFYSSPITITLYIIYIELIHKLINYTISHSI